MRTTLTIEIDVDVEYDFERGEKETRDCPGSGPRARDCIVTIGGIDITKALDKMQIEEIEDECCQDAIDSDQAAYESAMEAKDEARRERD